MKKERILGKALILIFIPITAILLSVFSFSKEKMAYDGSIPLSKNLMTHSPASPSSPIHFSAIFHDITPNTVVYLSYELPETVSDEPTLYFLTEQQYVTVSLDNRLIYSYQPTPNWFGRSPGNTLHLVSLPANRANAVLTIALLSPYKNFSGKISQVWIGSKSSHIINIIKEDLIPFTLCIFSIFMGIILLIIHIRLSMKEIRNTGTLYLSIFLILSGLWIAAERKILLLFWNDPVFMLNLALISLYILPLPLLLFIKRLLHPERSRYIVYFYWAFFIFFVGGTILQVLSIADYVILLPLFHLLAALCILYTLYAGIQEIRLGNKNIRIFLYGCLVFALSIMADVLLFYLAETPRMDTQGFFMLGMLLFILSSSWNMGKNLLQIRDFQTKNRMLHSLAYTDGLTHLKNRTSFNEMVKTLGSCLDSENSIALVILDINNLKTINDTFGHTEGDHLIKECARILRESLGKLGIIYRIGGDEFAMIIRNTPIAIINESIAELFERIDNYNECAKSFKISMAYGMDSYQKGKDKDLNSVFIRADKAMYRCKSNQKLIRIVGQEQI